MHSSFVPTIYIARISLDNIDLGIDANLFLFLGGVGWGGKQHN